MELLGVQMIVAHETGSLKMLGYFGAAQLVPILLLGLVGGLLADRVNRKTLLLVTQFLMMLIAAALAVLSWFDLAHWKWLLLLTMSQGLVMAFNIPAWQVLTPRLVPKSELTAALTLQGLQFNAARVIGPALAGYMLGLYGTTPLFILNALSFVGVLAVCATTPDAPAPPAPESGRRVRAELREAAAFVFLRKGPLCVLLAMALMSMLAAPLIRMLPLFVIDVYGYTESQADKATGSLLAMLGLGAVGGGIALKYLPAWYPKHHFIPFALTGAGVSVTLFSLTTNSTLGHLVMILVGVYWIWGFNQTWAAMQHLVPDEMRGRVMSISNVAAFGLTAAGNVASGLFGEWSASLLGDRAIGTQLAVGGLSFVLLLAGLAMMIWRVPEVDGLPRLFPGKRASFDLANALLAKNHRPKAEVEYHEPT
jgi:MFS family permease